MHVKGVLQGLPSHQICLYYIVRIKYYYYVLNLVLAVHLGRDLSRLALGQLMWPNMEGASIKNFLGGESSQQVQNYCVELKVIWHMIFPLHHHLTYLFI